MSSWLVGCGGSPAPDDDGGAEDCGCPEEGSDPRVRAFRCQDGACHVMCEPGFLDCDGTPDCEAEVGVENCGECGNSCDVSADAVHTSGTTCEPYTDGAACEYVCDAGWADRDGTWKNGCEDFDWQLVTDDLGCEATLPLYDNDPEYVCDHDLVCEYEAGGGHCTQTARCDSLLDLEGGHWVLGAEICDSEKCLRDEDCPGAHVICDEGFCRDARCDDVTCGVVDGEVCWQLCGPGAQCDESADCNGTPCVDGVCEEADCVGTECETLTCEDTGCGFAGGESCGDRCNYGVACDEAADCAVDFCTDGQCLAEEGEYCAGNSANCAPGFDCIEPFSGGGEARCAHTCESSGECDSPFTCQAGYCQ